MRILTLLLIIAIAFLKNDLFSQEIAFSFDDAPRKAGRYFSAEDRADIIINKLKNAGIKQAAFYVVSSAINDSTIERIRRYNDAGHLICNHSHTHRFASKISADDYIKEIKTCDSTIKNFSNYTKLYRYTFLDHGYPESKRDSIRDGLNDLGYDTGYITVDNYDWYIEKLFQDALKDGKDINMDKLREFYLNHIIESIEFYRELSVNALRRESKHVLLLHENDLAALFLDDLAKALRSKGWKFITTEEAYSDDYLQKAPKTLKQFQGRVAALAIDNGFTGRFSQESEDTDYLDKKWKEAGIEK
jgi:peptidoglycan/xylan/chitin deacetylase (PgdA/CDA1 family)